MGRATGLIRWGYDAMLKVMSLAEGFDELVLANILSEPDFATHANWATTGEFNDTGGNAALVFAGDAIGGTLTQAYAGFANTPIVSKPFRFTYTVAVTTAPDGDFAMVISTGFAEVEVPLPVTAGTHTVFGKVAAGAAALDFVITATETTATEGSITLDDFVLSECCDAANHPDCDEWVLIKPIEGNATVYAVSIVGDDLSSVELLEPAVAGIPGRFSRVVNTVGNVLVYRR